MLLPHMLSQLVLSSITTSLAFGTTIDRTELQLEQLLTTMNSILMTDALRISPEGIGATRMGAHNSDP